MDSPQRAPARTPLRTEVLWFSGVLLWWTALAVGGFAWLLAELLGS